MLFAEFDDNTAQNLVYKTLAISYFLQITNTAIEPFGVIRIITSYRDRWTEVMPKSRFWRYFIFFVTCFVHIVLLAAVYGATFAIYGV